VEALGAPGRLIELQQAFWDNDGFQCGFCPPGQLFAARALLRENDEPDESEIRQVIAGNLCRCTGYRRIVSSVQDTARGARRAAAATTEGSA
jgi:aerobic-type carbon monoxide dehydrogenase small subunit (CoxS/CutS family)